MATFRIFSKALSRELRRSSVRMSDGTDTYGPHHSEIVEDAWTKAVASVMNGNKARVYGIELEVPTSRGLLTTQLAALDRLRAGRVEDRSLNSGSDIEFRFPPLSVDAIKRMRLIDRTRKILGSRTWEPELDEHNTYGIHIHSNIAWMKELTPYIVSYLVRSNSLFFQWVSGRLGYSRYEEPASYFYSKMATCVQLGLGTLEWRIFRSTYNQELVNLWLDLIRAVEDWAEQQSPSHIYATDVDTDTVMLHTPPNVLTLESFFQFVLSNKRRYQKVARLVAVWKGLHVYWEWYEDDDGEDRKRLSSVLEDYLHLIYQTKQPRPKKDTSDASLPLAA